ncbi:MAG: transcriptional regulator [Rhodospirillaceae bacterium]|nr:MAG: transcriptional regulator [Rhodospirillaceae bacterium]
MNEKKVKSILDARGVKYVWLADKLGITRSLVTQWFNNGIEIPEKHHIRIAEILNMPLVELR